MAAEISNSERTSVETTVNLGKDLTILEVTGLQQSMLELVERSANIQLDGSSVMRVDAAGLQLLAALTRESKLRRAELQWIGVSESLADASKLLGLEEALHLKSQGS